MALRKFTEFGAASRSEVTLRVNQTLFISRGLLNTIGIGDIQSAYLYIDDEKPVLGIQFLKEYGKEDRTQRKLAIEKSGVSVNIAPILRYFRIEKLGEKKNLEVEEKNGILVINLESIVTKQNP